MTHSPVNVGIIGCGNIAGSYASDLRQYPHLRLVGAADVDPARAQALAESHGCTAYQDTDALLADPSIDLVINLTIHRAHYDVTMRSFAAGKHVYSEKPLAASYAEAHALVEEAQRRGLRLGSSPFTFLCEAPQTGLQLIRAGQLGAVRLVYAEVNWGRIETWHPNPVPFYEIGALWDVGVYPLTMITAFLGPARRVRAGGAVLLRDRATLDGAAFQIETPDYVAALIELDSGTQVRLTTNFYVATSQQHSGVEFHGDKGSLHIASWMSAGPGVGYAPFGEPFSEVPLLRPAPERLPWGVGVADMASALREDRPHRATGEQAAHIVEILEATATSIREDRTVAISSTFTPPSPMEWAT